MSRLLWLLALMSLPNSAQQPDESDVHVGPEHLPGFHIPSECPKNLLEWKNEREKLRSATSITKVLGFGILLEKCSKLPEQLPIFNNAEFKACTSRIRTVTKVLSVQEDGKSEMASQANLAAKVPADAFKLPEPFRNVDFWKQLHHATPEKEAELMAGILKQHPTSTTFKYRSNFNAKGFFYITHIPTEYGDRFIHFEDEMAIITLTRATKGADGKALKEPHFVLGQIRDTPEVVNDKPDFDKPGLAERLKQDIDIDSQGCFMCHQFGVMPVIPTKPEQTKSFKPGLADSAATKWLNDNFVKPESTAFNQFLVALPDFATDQGFRTPEFVNNCAPEKLSAKSAERVIKAMNCASCHDRSSVPALKYPFGVPAIIIQNKEADDKIVNYLAELSKPLENHEIAFDNAVLQIVMDSGHMPKNSNKEGHARFLNLNERIALRHCLLSEYLGNMYTVRQKLPSVGEGYLLKTLLEKPCPEK